MKNIELKRVLFYTHSPRMFRSTLIGHLFFICQEWPVVLVSEKLDLETENLLKNKKIFPKLEKVVSVGQFTATTKKKMFSKNKQLCSLAKKLIKEEEPNIVVTASDMHSLFEMYLMRFAKRAGAVNVCFQGAVDADSKISERWVDYINAYTKFPKVFPLTVRVFLVKIKKYFGHFLYHWVLPLSAGQKPLTGKSSYILRTGNSGMRDADYEVVFSERDSKVYQNAGVSVRKLRVLPHPLAIKKSRDFFEKAFLNKLKNRKTDERVALLLMPSSRVGFRRKDWSLIPEQEHTGAWFNIIRLVHDNLPKWKIIIKPHPDVDNIQEVKKELEKISNSIIITDPKESVDKYLEMADIIIDLPRSASTVVFTALLQCPGKPTAALDFHQEVLGDFYKDFKGVEYIENEKKLVEFLKNIPGKSVESGLEYGKITDYGTMDLLREIVKKYD